jgi:hypothetical protein
MLAIIILLVVLLCLLQAIVYLGDELIPLQ